MSAIPILTFHSVDSTNSVISVSPSQLEAILSVLDNHRFETITIAEAAQEFTRAESSRRRIALTFDDGFENFYTEVFPRLRERAMKATVYVVSERCGCQNDWNARGLSIPRLSLMSWDQIGELHAHGVEIGAHSRTHPDLRALSDTDLALEVDQSAAQIEETTGGTVSSFAYPFGLHDQRVRAFARKRYSCAVGTRLGSAYTGENPHALSRIDAFYLRDRPALLLQPWREPYLLARRGLRALRARFRAQA